MRGRLLIAPSLQYLEHAYNHAKYGEFSAAPVMEITVPTRQRSDAGAGRHSTCCRPSCNTRPMRSRRVGRAAGSVSWMLCSDALERYAPGLRGCIVGAELLTPADMEQEFRISGGHWHHGDLAFDQFFMVRPVPGAAQYRTPWTGLFLCGAGCHPGGGVMGIAGRNAAQQVLKAGSTCAMTESAAPHFKQPLLKTPFHERARALEPGRQFHSVGGLHDGRCVHHGGAGIFRDSQCDDALRPDADGEVPHRRARMRWPYLQSPGHARCRQAQAGPGRLLRLVQRCRASASTTARCFAWARTSTAFARRSGRSIGCSIRRIGFDVEIGEVTEQIAALAVQGPTSCAVLKALGLQGVERLKPFEIGYFALGTRAADRVAHRLHRRPGLRAVDGARTRPRPSGMR